MKPTINLHYWKDSPKGAGFSRIDSSQTYGNLKKQIEEVLKTVTDSGGCTAFDILEWFSFVKDFQLENKMDTDTIQFVFKFGNSEGYRVSIQEEISTNCYKQIGSIKYLSDPKFVNEIVFALNESYDIGLFEAPRKPQ